MKSKNMFTPDWYIIHVIYHRSELKGDEIVHFDFFHEVSPLPLVSRHYLILPLWTLDITLQT